MGDVIDLEQYRKTSAQRRAKRDAARLRSAAVRRDQTDRKPERVEQEHEGKRSK